MPIIKPPVLPAWADAGDKIQPTTPEIATGWPLSNIPPSRQRFNWILNFVANGIRYFCRRGLPDYDAAETYMIGDCIIGNDGNNYKSLADNNTGNLPSSSPNMWTLWALTQTQADSRYALKTQGGILTVRLIDTVGVTTAGLGLVDGVQTVAGDLVLRAVGTNQNNIVYVVGSGQWTAYPLANIRAGTMLTVQEGTQNADTIWELKTDGNITIGASPLNWVDVTASLKAAIATEAAARAAADTALSQAITSETNARNVAIAAIPTPSSVGQSWTSFDSSQRAQGVTYTNDTGKTIQVFGVFGCNGGGQGFIYIDGNLIARWSAQFNGCGGWSCNMGALIPPGATYMLANMSGGFNSWWELR